MTAGLVNVGSDWDVLLLKPSSWGAPIGLDVLVVDVRCFALRNIVKTRKDLPTNALTILLEISGAESYMVFVDGELPFIYDIFMSEYD